MASPAVTAAPAINEKQKHRNQIRRVLVNFGLNSKPVGLGSTWEGSKVLASGSSVLDFPFQGKTKPKQMDADAPCSL